VKFYLVVYQIEGDKQPSKWTVLRTVSLETAKKDIAFRDTDLASRSVEWHVVACIPVVDIIQGCERT
jgi:hypothetical protein